MSLIWAVLQNKEAEEWDKGTECEHKEPETFIRFQDNFNMHKRASYLIKLNLYAIL